MKRHGLFLYVVSTIFIVGASDIYDFHLPKEVKPTDYDISIRPNLTEGTYQGAVVIKVNVTENTNSITLHSKNLKILYAKINAGETILTKYAPYDFIILSSNSKIVKGIHNVTIYFEGDMKNKTFGFFRGYEEEHGRKVYFGASFFEPMNARTAFPCFDEPTFKAKFSVNILKPPGYVALSNMNKIGQTLNPDGYAMVHFAKSPPMPTYLVSFFVGNYSYVEDFYVKQNKERIPTRVYSPLPKIKNAELAAHEIPKQLRWFVNYTGYDYMLPKLDYITINSKFHIEGGMEDWGATTSREDSIFYNNKMSILQQRRVKNVAHEFGHIWFGDLVTTSSWGEFWLNEGFARFMDIKSNDIYKEQEEAISSYVQTLLQALWRDDDLTARPLYREIKEPFEVYDILNTINYEKGGSVLKMVENLIGEKRMQEVIQAYIKKHHYGSVTSQSFIDVLQTFVQFNASDFLHGFIKQSGYPLVTVKLHRDCLSVSLQKERFLRFGQPRKDGRWSLPVKYITNLNTNPQIVWFNSTKNHLKLKFPKKISWIKLNFQLSGYYRTNYSFKMWQKLIKFIKNFTTEDRINLLDDSMAIVRSGKLPCMVALEATKYLCNEEKVEVWEAAQSIFGKIRTGLLQHNITIAYLKKYIVGLIDTQYQKQSWAVAKNETFRTKNTRSIIFNLACYYGHEGCRNMVKKLWPERNSLPVDIKNIVLIYDAKKKINYNHTVVNGMESMSTWFGADLSKLSLEPEFRWPKKIMENCNEWLKDHQ